MSAISSVKATVNGQEYLLNYNSQTGAYEASVTAPSVSSYTQNGHFFGVTIKAEDVAGNVTTVDANDAALGNSLKLYVKEKVKPVVAFVSPTSGAALSNNKPAIIVNVTDDDSGVDLSTFKLKIDNGADILIAACQKTAISGGYRITYTPASGLADGNHTISASIKDYDGNESAASSITIKVDTVPPALTINSPENNSYTNKSACTVTGVTNDAHSSPVAVTILVNGTNVGAVTVGSDGSFSKAIALVEGVNTIKITASDSLGQKTEITRTVTLDTTAPEFESITLAPNPVDAGATYIITVKVND